MTEADVFKLNLQLRKLKLWMELDMGQSRCVSVRCCCNSATLPLSMSKMSNAEHDWLRSCAKWVRDNKELGRGEFGVVWRETCIVNHTVRAVKVISKHDPRLSPERRDREIKNFTTLREVYSHSLKHIIPLIIIHNSTLSTSSSFWNHSEMSTLFLLRWSGFSTGTLGNILRSHGQKPILSPSLSNFLRG